MGLNIKKPATEAAIRELAAQTGQSFTDPVQFAGPRKVKQMKTSLLTCTA
jgi:hypothetical protein